jgi:hypothetical protein
MSRNQVYENTKLGQQRTKQYYRKFNMGSVCYKKLKDYNRRCHTIGADQRKQCSTNFFSRCRGQLASAPTGLILKFFFPEIGAGQIECKIELTCRDRLRQRLHIRLHVYLFQTGSRCS